MTEPSSGRALAAASVPEGAIAEGRDLWTLLGTLPVPIAVHDLGDGAAVRFLNSSFTRVFGYALADVPTLDAWAERAYPDPVYRQEVMARWAAEIAARKTTGQIAPPGEFRIVDRAGRPRDVLVGFALQAEQVIVTFQDLTDTRAAEVALEVERRATERTAYTLTENMPAGAFTMVLRPGAELAEFSFVSRQFLQMLDLTHAEAVGDPMNAFSRVHPADRPRWLRVNAEAFARRVPFSDETQIVAHGETRWVRAESVTRTLEDGSVIWEGVLVDITRLKETEAQLKAVLSAARAYTWHFDLRRQTIEFVESWAATQGYGPGEVELTLASWLEGVHPEDAPVVMARLEHLVSGASGQQSSVYRRRLADGQWHWLQTHAGISQRDAAGKPIALSGVSFDVTDEMTALTRAEEHLAQLREELQRAQQRDTVVQIAGGVAHDLNNLIAVVAGTVEMLELRADDLPWLQKGLARIRRSVGMAHDLIAGLGGLVRPDLPRAAHDLAEMLRTAVDLLGQRRIGQHGVRVALRAPHPQVWANPTEIAQVIVNLAINACDSGTPERPAMVTITALPAGTAPPARAPDAGEAPPAAGATAIFTISDTGTGITEAVRARMFRPNFTTKGKDRTGMGLLIVSTILQGNRAAIWADSAPGGGTIMTVAWPAAPPTPGLRTHATRVTGRDFSESIRWPLDGAADDHAGREP